MDMQHKFKCLRDPVLFRSNPTKHHRTGNKYHCYPTYDFSCPIVDSLEGITHCLRTVEYKERDPLYHWVCDNLKLKCSNIYEFSKLNMVYTLMSKRKLQELVDAGVSEGWNDPRFPTVQGILRRGMTVEALKEFMLSQGPSKNTINMEWDKIWAMNKKIIDLTAERFNAISEESSSILFLENGPEGIEGKSVPKHPKNQEMGDKVRIYSNSVYVENEDFSSVNVGDKFTLMRWGNAILTKKTVLETGGFELSATLKLDDTDYKKTPKVCWVTASENMFIKVSCFEFDHLLTKKSLEKTDNVDEHINHDSKQVSTFITEKDLHSLKKGAVIQIERRGYFRIDKTLISDGKVDLIFIPDGKTKNISTLKAKVDAKAVAGKKEEKKVEKKSDQPEEKKELSKKELKKLEKKAEKAKKKAEHKAKEEEEEKKD